MGWVQALEFYVGEVLKTNNRAGVPVTILARQAVRKYWTEHGEPTSFCCAYMKDRHAHDYKSCRECDDAYFRSVRKAKRLFLLAVKFIKKNLAEGADSES